jgi:hypothetical protein
MHSMILIKLFWPVDMHTIISNDWNSEYRYLMQENQMAEAKISPTVSSHNENPSTIEDFKEFLELHATAMEMSGFMQEAGNLRRWTAELAQKSSDKAFS